jgi:hypothetical protein
MKTYHIKPFLLTRMEIDHGIMTYLYKYGTKIKIPIYFWYIEGADMNILVDTGADAKMATSFRSLPAEHVQTFEQALASIGLKP